MRDHASRDIDTAAHLALDESEDHTERPTRDDAAGLPDPFDRPYPFRPRVDAVDVRDFLPEVIARPRLLDLFCGAGGGSEGFTRAGFEVVGVDRVPQPDYPYEWHCADALDVLDTLLAGEEWEGYVLADFTVFAASPPCLAYSLATLYHGAAHQAAHPNLYAPTKARLEATGAPYVIENVERSPLRRDVVLCGEMFGLRVHRHRVFEVGGGPFIMQPRHAPHVLRGALHNCHVEAGVARLVAGHYANHADALDAMGFDRPMSRMGLANAIPPAYTQFIGEQLRTFIGAL